MAENRPRPRNEPTEVQEIPRGQNRGGVGSSTNRPDTSNRQSQGRQEGRNPANGGSVGQSGQSNRRDVADSTPRNAGQDKGMPKRSGPAGHDDR